jgi:hypothetical protein
MLFKVHPVRDPALRQITQRFGENPGWYTRFSYDGASLRGHNGIDFGLPIGSQVQAVDDGTILDKNFDPQGFGYYVKLMHTWGQSIYGHLSKPDATGLSGAQAIHAADLVGLSGNTGFSTGPHLHFGVRIYPYHSNDGWGGFSDPLPYLEELYQMPVSDTDLEQIRQTAWSIVAVPYYPTAALAKYAHTQSLGAPLTKEFTVGPYQCQAFALGIAYVPIGQWDQAKHIAW